MNWFERYGIVGAYFLIVLFLWLYPFSFFKIPQSNGKFVIAIFVFAFLPLGYILTIFSQRLYYAGFNGKQIHKEVLSKIDKDWKAKLNLNDNPDEAKCEARMTSFLRFEQREKISTEALKYLTDFSTRRWDVLAINRSIILSTILSFAIFLFMIFLGVFSKNYPTICALDKFLSSFSLKECFCCYLTLMILVSCGVILILMQSNRILNDQVMQVLEDTFNKIDVKKKIRKKIS